MSCLKPLLLQRRRSLFKPDVYGSDTLNTDYAPYSHSLAVVPCGKCVQCLKRRQFSIASRCVSEAQSKGSMHFLTLTYSDEFLPIAVRLQVISKESGEVFQDFLPQVLDRSVYSSLYSLQFLSAREELLKSRPSSSPRYSYRTILETEDFIYRYVFTPSLNRRDFRLWLKSARIAYKRQFGVSLPDFSYACVGEYGPKTCRPHYHVAFFGLSFVQVQWLESRWEYGFTYLEKVNAKNTDGSDGFACASRYVGKYLVKGKFDCQSVIDGFSEKGRLCCSKSLGFKLDSDGNLPEELLSYYRCYDLFGKYDIDTLRIESTNKLLNDEQINSIISEARKRNFLSLSGQNFPLPPSIVRRIWYVVTPAFVRPSKIRAMAQSASLNGYLGLYREKLRQYQNDVSSEASVLSARSFSAILYGSDLVPETVSEISFINSYSKSVF